MHHQMRNKIKTLKQAQKKVCKLIFTSKIHKDKTTSMMSSRMFLEMMLKPENNLPDIDLKKFTDFDDSQIFWLEKLGEGAFGLVRKAYKKKENKFSKL